MDAINKRFQRNPSSGNCTDTCRKTERQTDERTWRG